MTKKRLNELIKKGGNVFFANKDNTLVMINLIGVEKIVGDYMFIYDKAYKISNILEENIGG